MAEARKRALDQLQEANKSLEAAGLSSEDAAKRLKVAAEKVATETAETAVPQHHSWPVQADDHQWQLLAAGEDLHQV
eukprot:8908368-Pyramimonas_sp.AAC.1